MRGARESFRAQAGAFQAPAFYFHTLPTIPVIAAVPGAGARKLREQARERDRKARACGFLSIDASRALRVTDKLAMLPFGNDI